MISFDHEAIMSGRRKGLVAATMRGILWTASFPYRAAVTVRNRRYDRGKAEICRSEVPVISVGNLTTGGTGKTPIVCALAKWFRQRGVRVAIVSRGYGSDGQDSNDEAKELHARLPDVPHVQDPDRVEAARVAVEELDCQVILMDDGFQHRRLHRDLNIVVIDVTRPFGFGHLLPRGLLREPIGGLRRADLVVLSRCSSVSESELDRIEDRVRHFGRDSVPIVRCDHRPSELLEFPDQKIPIDQLKGKRVATICAIGNPAAFESTVRSCGAEIKATYRLPDHAAFQRETIDALRQWIASKGDEFDQIVCTHKDLVKLQVDRLEGKPVRAVLIDLSFRADETTTLECELESIADRIKTP